MGRVKALVEAVGEQEAAEILAGKTPLPTEFVPPKWAIPDPVDDLLRAQRAAAAMNAATARLNAAIETAEKKLAELNLGVTANVPFTSEDDEEGHWSTYLRFGKDAREWRLMVDTVDERDDETQSPLLSCSRETRLNSLKVLPALFVAIVEQAEREAQKVASEVAVAEHFLGTWRAK